MIIIGREVFDRAGQKYVVEKHIGSGGFGNVFLVTHDEQQMALKSAGVDGMTTLEVEALCNEGLLAESIDHENVIKIHFFHDGQKFPALPPYLLMDYANGGSLKDFIDSRKGSKTLLSEEELRTVMLQIANGMKAVNEKLIHRDFHPGNVLFQNGVLKITDFGLAKVVDASTRAKTFKGIQHMYYKAPESWNMEANTVQLDMYSVGVVFFELAALRFPYELPKKKEALVELMDAHLFSNPTNPRALNPMLSINVSDLILKMLKKRPADRPKNWEEVIAVLTKEDDGKSGKRINVSKLVAKAKETDKAAEAARIEREKQEREKAELGNKIRLAISQIEDDVREVVTEVNEGAGATSLRFDGRGDTFAVKSVGKKLETKFCFYPTKKVERVQTNAFSLTGPVIQFEQLKLEGREVLAWGYAQNRSGRGLNLLLVKKGTDDSYGEWMLMSNQYNALFQRSGVEPFPITRWEEFEKQIAVIRAMGHIRSVISSYAISAFDFLFEEIL